MEAFSAGAYHEWRRSAAPRGKSCCLPQRTEIKPYPALAEFTTSATRVTPPALEDRADSSHKYPASELDLGATGGEVGYLQVGGNLRWVPKMKMHKKQTTAQSFNALGVVQGGRRQHTCEWGSEKYEKSRSIRRLCISHCKHLFPVVCSQTALKRSLFFPTFNSQLWGGAIAQSNPYFWPLSANNGDHPRLGFSHRGSLQTLPPDSESGRPGRHCALVGDRLAALGARGAFHAQSAARRLARGVTQNKRTAAPAAGDLRRGVAVFYRSGICLRAVNGDLANYGKLERKFWLHVGLEPKSTLKWESTLKVLFIPVCGCFAVPVSILSIGLYVRDSNTHPLCDFHLMF